MDTRDYENLESEFERILDKRTNLSKAELKALPIQKLRILLAHEEDADGAPEELIEQILDGRSFPTTEDVIGELIHVFCYDKEDD